MTKPLFPYKLIFGFFFATGLFAQVAGQTPREFSLAEAIKFATEQNINIKNAQLDALSAESRIGEIRSIGLPQLSVSGQLVDNVIIQKFFLPPNAFDPNAPADAPPVAVRFGIQYTGNATASLNQLLFDASWLLGLKAANTYRELAQKTVTQSKVTVAEAVAKAYYGVLVSQSQSGLLEVNISRIDTLLRETRALNKSGFVEKLDVDRLEVQLNNLKTEQQKVKNLVELSYYLLKFQMGLGVNDPVVLTDKVDSLNVDQIQQELTLDPNFNYAQRIEYSILKTQETLADLDVQNYRKQYFPRLSAFANYGYNVGINEFKIFTTPWFNSASIGLNVAVPVFDGFQKKFKIQQAKLTLQKVQQSQVLLQNSIDLQIRQASITMNNNLETIRNQQRNLQLAQEVVRVSRIKYKEGVGSSIEVQNAESAYREAQTNYFTALYDLLSAKVDLEIATGKLTIGN